jgi:hypothetical protein
MKPITETPTVEKWPRKKVKSVGARERDLIVRITDWTDDKDEPAYDVETYIGGVYDWNESRVFTLRGSTKAKAKRLATAFANKQITKLL